MKPWRFLSLVVLLLAAIQAHAQVPPEKALATFQVADDLELSLFASEPMFVNPTSIDVDHKGRVWVCESVNYRNHLRRQPKLNRVEGDRIVILEDTDGDGKADKATTFYQAPDFIAPLGIAVAATPLASPASPPRKRGEPQRYSYKVFVCHSPHLYVFEDADGDGKADGPPKKLLTGFGGYDHDHGIHGVSIGPDMKLYFTVGDTGVHGLQASDGKGKKWQSNQTDCRAGTVWRCDLDGKNLELIAHNFRNNYECCVDSFGTIFLSDNDDDGNQQTRICYVMPGGNYGYHPRGPGQTHWHEEQPGVVPKILRTYFGSPCGMCVYEGTLLPEKYRGTLLHADAGPRHIRSYRTKPKGAGYDVERTDIVTNEKDSWFRPSDVCVAPDGSVMIADWYDPGVGGHGMGDTTRGRIWRLTPKGHKGYKVPKVDVESKEGVLAALGSPNLAMRYLAMSRIQKTPTQPVLVDGKPLPDRQPKEERDIELVKTLQSIAASNESQVLRARAMWQLGVFDSKKIRGYFGPVLNGLDDPDPNFRVVSHRITKEHAGFVAENRTKLTQETSSAVRREMLLLLRDESRLKLEFTKKTIYELARLYDGTDRFYLEALGIAVGHHDQKRREIILADFEKHFPEWNDKVADLVWELRPPSMMASLGKRLADAKISAAGRARIIDILAASDDPAAGKALLGQLTNTELPPEVRTRILDNLRQFLPGKWRTVRDGDDIEAMIQRLCDFGQDVRTGLALVAVAERTKHVPRVMIIAGDAHNQMPVRKEAVKTLGLLPSSDAVIALETLLADKDLAADAVQALAAHVPTLGEKPGTKAALMKLKDLALTGKPAEVQATAVAALAGTRAGTTWLIDLHTQKKLPETVVGQAASLVRNSPFPDLRNKALIAFPPPGRLDPKKLPTIASLATRRGNAEHGKQLLAASVKNDMACLKCHTVRGLGGQIGPDLSMIGKKGSRENLFESILYPSKAVADQFVTWQIETTKGVSLAGLIVEETADAVTLRDANGKDTKIPKKDIDGRTKSPKSLMPDDLLVYMTEADLVDMVEYLVTLKTPVLAMDYWHILGPFDNGTGDAGLDEVLPPEKGIDLKAGYKGKSGMIQWRTVRPNAASYVDLQAHYSPEHANIVSYLYREIDSPADQEATILLGVDDACKLWLNDELVHTDRRHNAAQPEADAVKVKLKKGKNKILLKINNGDGPHGLYFSIVAEQELKRL